MYYRRMRTSTGNRFTVRVPEDERAAKWAGKIAAGMMTFICTAGMFLLWIKIG